MENSQTEKQLLIVDDEPAQLQTLADIFTDEGYQVTSCLSFEDALKSYNNLPKYSVAVVDLQLGSDGGVQILEHFRNTRPDIRCVIHTAYGSFDTARDAINLGVYAYVEKLQHPRELIYHVNRATQAGLNDALADSEQRFGTLVKLSPIAIHELDLQKRFISINPSGLDMLGVHDPAEMIGSNFLNYVEESDRVRINQLLDAAIAGKPCKFKFLTFEARSEIVSANFVPIKEHGVVVKLLGVAQDVSVQSASEHALRESELRFRKMFEQAAVGVALVNTNSGELIRVNNTYATTLGYQPAELIGKTFMEISSDTELEKDLENLKKLHVGEIDSYSMDKQLITKTGATIWTNLTVSPMWHPDDEPEFHLAIVKDISEQKEYEQALSESERLLAKAQEIAKLASWQVDFSMNKISVSDQIYKIFGDLINRIELNDTEGFLDIFLQNRVHPDDHQLIRSAYFEINHSGKATPIEFRIFREPDHQERYVRVEFEIEMDPRSDTIARLAGSIQDITEQKANEELLRQHHSELMHVGRLVTMGEMVAGIAHEINQPLFSITNFANSCNLVLQRNNSDSIPLLQSWLADILQQANRANEIIRRLADFVRNDAPRREIEEFNQLVRSAINLTTTELRRQKITLNLELGSVSIPVQVDEVQIQQVVVNLVRNATEALQTINADQKVINISTFVDNKFVVFQIEDNGPGLDAEIKTNIFAAFVTNKKEGMGMGLAICRSIVEAHGGELTVRPNHSGGATFAFTLPIRVGAPIHAK